MSTLIYGETNALLVDPPLTSAQAGAVAEWVAASGKNLKFVYVTHGHGDHWFGASPVLVRFPEAKVLALPCTIEMMRSQGSAKARPAPEPRLLFLFRHQ